MYSPVLKQCVDALRQCVVDDQWHFCLRLLPVSVKTWERSQSEDKYFVTGLAIGFRSCNSEMLLITSQVSVKQTFCVILLPHLDIHFLRIFVFLSTLNKTLEQRKAILHQVTECGIVFINLHTISCLSLSLSPLSLSHCLSLSLSVSLFHISDSLVSLSVCLSLSVLYLRLSLFYTGQLTSR